MRTSNIDKMLKSDVCNINGCSGKATKRIVIFDYVDCIGDKKSVYANVCEECFNTAHESRKEKK